MSARTRARLRRASFGPAWAHPTGDQAAVLAMLRPGTRDRLNAARRTPGPLLGTVSASLLIAMGTDIERTVMGR